MEMPLNRQGGRVRAPWGEDARKSKIHPGAIPGNLFRNDFLAVRRSWRGNGMACFWVTSLEEIFGGVIAIISFRPGGWMQQSAVPRCAILSVGSTGGIG